MTGVTWSPASGNVFTEVEATITFTDDDVRAVYVDWDDGASNKKDEANYQGVQFTEPKSVWSGNHTYTASGAYNPVIQTMNSKGFFSKYYTYDADAGENGANPEVSPSIGDTGINTINMYDGQATGIMRVENKTVKSGIDNSIFEWLGPRDIKLMIPPLLKGADLTTIGSVIIEIQAKVRRTVLNDTRDDMAVAGTSDSIETLSTTLSSLTSKVGFTDVDIDGGQVVQVLKVTYKNPKYTTDPLDFDANALYNRLKVFVAVEAPDENGLLQYYPITYVSAGSPIKKVNDSTRYITMDFSQSRAKASNISIDSYRYDNGKSLYSPANQWTYRQLHDIFGDQTKQTSTLKTIHYTYGSVSPWGLGAVTTMDGYLTEAFDSSSNAAWKIDSSSAGQEQWFRTDQFLIDDFGRFADNYHMVRMSADPNTTGTGSVSNVSSIIANKPYVFRITPAINWTGTQAVSPVKLDNSDTGNFTADYTLEACNNVGASGGSTGMVLLSGMNDQDFEYIDGDSRTANEYLLLLFDKKTDKIFLDISNYSNGLTSCLVSGTSYPSAAPTWGSRDAVTGWDIAGVSYLSLENSGTNTQIASWKALDFEDTTKVSREFIDTSNDKYETQSNSLSKSGLLSWDMPTDWTSTTMKNLCGGVLAPSAPYSTTVSTDIALEGTVGTPASSTYYGLKVPVTLDSTSQDNLSDAGIDSETMGRFQYIFIITGSGDTGEERMYWVNNGNESGLNSAGTIMYLHYGDTTYATAPAGTIAGKLRRVNLYDVIDGFSKVYRGDSDTELVPVDAQASWDNKYIINTTGSGVGKALLDAWKDNDMYALKISLSGQAGEINGEDKDSWPTIRNIFSANEGHVAVIKQIDDSAYNLNALPVTSDLAVSRGGNYYSAITRKGKVFIARTGEKIENISLSSVALGDGTFDTYSASSSLYGQLRTIRNLHSKNARVYWDEEQKDGTFVRYWGVITQVDETHGTGGPKSVINYNCNVMIEEIALIDTSGNLMTDLFPLGGISDGRDFN